MTIVTVPSELEKPTHVMRSWHQFFRHIVTGDKTHDLRDSRDRQFRVGDTVRLEEFDPVIGEYTGRSCLVRITFITSRDVPCAFSSVVLDRDYVILSIKLLYFAG